MAQGNARCRIHASPVNVRVLADDVCSHKSRTKLIRDETAITSLPLSDGEFDNVAYASTERDSSVCLVATPSFSITPSSFNLSENERRISASSGSFSVGSMVSDPSLVEVAHDLAKLHNDDDLDDTCVPSIPSQIGGHHAEFSQNVEDNLKCCVCLLVLRDPMQTPCGHRFCQSCIQHILKGRDPRCPVDRRKLLQVFPDAHCRREINSLKVKCNNSHVCKWTGVLQELEDHLESCPFDSVECENDGCHRRLERQHLSRHEEQECPHRLVPCRFCRRDIKSMSVDEHHDTSCLEVVKTCPNDGCTTALPRRALAAHTAQDCAEASVPCKLGCGEMVRRRQLRSHTRDVSRSAEHLEGVLGVVDSLERKVLARDDMIEKLIFDLKSVKEDIRILKGNGTSHARDEPGDDGEAVQEAGRCTHEREIQELENNVAMVTAVTDSLKAEHELLSTASSKNSEQLDSHDLRIMALEKTSYSGTFVWKISGFQNALEAAVKNEKVSYYSQPFYTGRHGYKACLRMYPNGDGAGKGKYLSLFFVLMAGQYDSLIQWPFSRRVTLSLLDQSPSRRHISEAFMPNHASSSFQRPETGMNVASGCPCFVSHQVLKSGLCQYIRNDTLFLRAMIDVAGLNHA